MEFCVVRWRNVRSKTPHGQGIVAWGPDPSVRVGVGVIWRGALHIYRSGGLRGGVGVPEVRYELAGGEVLEWRN